MTTTFNDERWLAQRSVPKLVIESLMSDETQHQVKVPGVSPAWLTMVQAKMKAGNKHACILAPTDMAALADVDGINDSQAGDEVSDESESGDDVSDESDSSDAPLPQSKKRRRAPVRTRQVTQSQTWPVCVIRRSLSWLTISGNLMYTQLITPPSAMRQKGAEYLWSV